MSLNYKASRSGLKGFFLYHFEKILLVVAFAALAAFFAMGYGVESLEDGKSPTAMKDLVEQAKLHVERDTWTDVEKTPERAVQTDHQNRAAIARAAVRESFYVSPVLQTPIFKELVKRMDPEIMPPEQIEVAVKIGAVAQRPDRNWIDPLQDAVDPEIEAPKKKKETRPGFDPETGLPLGGYGQPGDVADPMMGYGSSPTGLPSNVKTLSPHLKTKFQKEYFTLSSPAALKGAYVVAVKAVVPMKRQREEYERTFLDATGYDPVRDRPEIVWFEAERAEVAPGAKDEDLVWALISDTTVANEMASKAAARAEEVADPAYLLPGVASFPVPPMVMVKLKDLGLHSLIPAAKSRVPGRPGATTEETTDAAAEEEEPAEIQRGPRAIKPGPAAGAPGYGGAVSPYGGAGMYADPSYGQPGDIAYGQPGDMAMPYGGSYGSGYGAPGAMADVDYKLVRFFDFDAEPGKTYRYRVRVFYRDANNLYAQKSGAGAASAAGAATAYAMPDATAYGGSSSDAYAGSGASYGGYGGYGSGGQTTLKEYMLAPEVLARLTALKAADAAAGAPKDTVTTYWRTTEWSVPSDDVVVPHRPEERYAGEGEGAKRVQLADGSDFPAPSAENHAKVAVSVWDNDRAVDVPTEIDAYRGTVLNRTGNVDVLHPARVAGGLGAMMGQMGDVPGGSPYGAYGPDAAAGGTPGLTAGPTGPIRRIKDYVLATDAVVLDVRGGDKLPGGDARNAMKSPSMMLIVNSRGELELASEVEDAEAYRDTLFIDPSEEKKADAMKKAAAAATSAYGAAGGYGQPGDPVINP